jgi:activator of HSP90 ATPase
MKPIKTKNIKQVVIFKASPHELYEMLMDSKRHAKFSGEKAKISKRVGAKFSAYGGWIQGKNLKLIPDRLIVQAWRGASWPKGHYSKVMYLFTKTKTGTKLTFGHTKVPATAYKGINSGWKSSYWDKMKAVLAGKKPKHRTM